MRNLRQLEKYRLTTPDIVAKYGSTGDDTCGMFMVHGQTATSLAGVQLKVIASSGDGWDHVSVSAKDRTPTWEEMEYIKKLFFKPNETAMQLHVPEDEHINYHPHCLHLWRPLNGKIPRPPSFMVGPKS